MTPKATAIATVTAKTPARRPFPRTTLPELDTPELEAAAVPALPEVSGFAVAVLAVTTKAVAIWLVPVCAIEPPPVETAALVTAGAELVAVEDTLVVCEAKVGAPERSEISCHTQGMYSRSQ
jgi:hypothetical protein